MRRFVPVVIALVAGAVARAQTPAADAAAAVLAAAREALGGEKKLAAIKTLVATGRTRQIRGENIVPIEFEIAMELPDRYVRKDETPAQESEPTTVGFNGAELIQLPVPVPPPARAGGPPPPTPQQMEAQRATRLATVRQDVARLALGLFASSFTSYPLTFAFAGKAEAPQGKADVLDVKGPNGFAARFFVDAEKHLPIMISWQPPAPPQRGGPPRGGPPDGRGGPAPAARGDAPPARGDAPAAPAPQGGRGEGAPGRGAGTPPPESRIYYGDYREVNGVQFPFRLRRASGPDTIEETTFDDHGFKINAKIDPKKFEVRK